MKIRYRNISNGPLTVTLLTRTEIVPHMGILEVDVENNCCRDVVRFRQFKWLQPLGKGPILVQAPVDPVPEKRSGAPIEPLTEMSKAIINEEPATPYFKKDASAEHVDG